MRGHAALQTDGARHCALPSASARPVTPAPAPRLPVQTLTLNSGPTEARAVCSLPLSTGDPPAVKHGAAPAAKRLRQNRGPKYDRQPLPPPLQTFGFVEPSGVAASPFLFRTRPRPLGGGSEAPRPLRALPAPPLAPAPRLPAAILPACTAAAARRRPCYGSLLFSPRGGAGPATGPASLAASPFRPAGPGPGPGPQLARGARRKRASQQHGGRAGSGRRSRRRRYVSRRAWPAASGRIPVAPAGPTAAAPARSAGPGAGEGRPVAGGEGSPPGPWRVG